MEPSGRSETQRIRESAFASGFHLVGFTPAVTMDGISRLVSWVANSYHGTMEYIPRRIDAYGDPNLVFERVQSVIALGVSYNGKTERAEVDRPSPTSKIGDHPAPENRGESADRANTQSGQIARYAVSGVDYHDVIRRRLKEFLRELSIIVPGIRGRGVVDTAPVLEREFAQQAGLGWFGKNTMLINRQWGSWFLLAAVLVDIPLEYDSPHASNHCGTCTRCLTACPTDAFPEPGVLDARRCISYLTIEHRGPIDRDLREGMGDWLFGCDVCQDVCPWNRKARISTDSDLASDPSARLTDALAFLQMTNQEFHSKYQSSPLARPGIEGMKRNALFVIANSGDPRHLSLVAQQRFDPSPTVRGAAAWAIGQLGSPATPSVLEQWLADERDVAVVQELQLAIARQELCSHRKAESS